MLLENLAYHIQALHVFKKYKQIHGNNHRPPLNAFTYINTTIVNVKKNRIQHKY